MAQYKVLQDIEAEDKFVGPLTLKQFIFAAIAALSLYLSVIFATRGAWIVLFILGPVIIVTGFLAFPWGRDQPTEVWLLAKIRFMFKPRRRIWDQTGMQELVRITAPKKVETQLSDGLSQTEVKSRLKALADTIDSRGWVVKNAGYDVTSEGPISDRLVSNDTLPKISNLVNDTEVNDDIFSSPGATRLDQQIAQNNTNHRSAAVDTMQQVLQNTGAQPAPQNNMWFMGAPEPATAGFNLSSGQSPMSGAQDMAQISPSTRSIAPSLEESTVLAHASQASTQTGFRNHKNLAPISDTRTAASMPPTLGSAVTAAPDPVTIGLARNDDRTVESLARETNKIHQPDSNDEVVISLH